MEKREFPVGIIGLAPLGMAIAELLMSQGLAVIGYRRSGMDEFAAAGGVPAETPADLVRRSGVVLDCLPHEEALLSLFDGEFSIMDAVTEGQIIVSLASHELANKERLADLVGQRGGIVLDGEVLGSPDQFATRDTTIFLSGDAVAIATVKPLVDRLTKHQVELGDFGEATRMRLSAQSVA